ADPAEGGATVLECRRFAAPTAGTWRGTPAFSTRRSASSRWISSQTDDMRARSARSRTRLCTRIARAAFTASAPRVTFQGVAGLRCSIWADEAPDGPAALFSAAVGGAFA